MNPTPFDAASTSVNKQRNLSSRLLPWYSFLISVTKASAFNSAITGLGLTGSEKCKNMLFFFGRANLIVQLLGVALQFFAKRCLKVQTNDNNTRFE